MLSSQATDQGAATSRLAGAPTHLDLRMVTTMEIFLTGAAGVHFVLPKLKLTSAAHVWRGAMSSSAGVCLCVGLRANGCSHAKI